MSILIGKKRLLSDHNANNLNCRNWPGCSFHKNKHHHKPIKFLKHLKGEGVQRGTWLFTHPWSNRGTLAPLGFLVIVAFFCFLLATPGFSGSGWGSPLKTASLAFFSFLEHLPLCLLGRTFEMPWCPAGRCSVASRLTIASHSSSKNRILSASIS